MLDKIFSGQRREWGRRFIYFLTSYNFRMSLYQLALADGPDLPQEQFRICDSVVRELNKGVTVIRDLYHRYLEHVRQFLPSRLQYTGNTPTYDLSSEACGRISELGYKLAGYVPDIPRSDSQLGEVDDVARKKGALLATMGVRIAVADGRKTVTEDDVLEAFEELKL